MEDKIVYYLGAGASALALPVVKNRDHPELGLAGAMKALADRILNDQIPKDIALYVRKLCKDFTWLAEEGRHYATIDTFAKYLFLTDNENYEVLKATLSAFFSLEQIVMGKLDSRYIPWLVSILEKNQFPSNVKIISWNYDFQLQLAAKIFKEESYSIAPGNIVTSKPPFINYFPPVSTKLTSQTYSLIQLNGIAGFLKGNDVFDGHAHLHPSKDKWDLLREMSKNERYHKLGFAWETSSSLNPAIQMVKGTTILVIIGYSFPFFNRNVDRNIFRTLTSTLKKIYFQDPHLDGSFLRNQFNLDPKISIEHIKDTDAFYIPFEL